MLVVANEEDALAQLRAGQLCCTRCGGPLAPWGYARPRKLRGVAGTAVELKPRRARCRSCKSAHVVLPGWCLPRRRDTAQVVVGALVAKASGAGHRKIANCLGLPPTTVRGWVRAATSAASYVARVALQVAFAADARLGSVAPRPTPLASAMEALGLAASALMRALGPVAEPWDIVVAVSGGRLLGPVPPG